MSWEAFLALDLQGRDLVENDGGIIVRGPIKEVKKTLQNRIMQIEFVRDWVALWSKDERQWRLMKQASTICRFTADAVRLSSDGKMFHITTLWEASYTILPPSDNIKQPERLFWSS